MPLKRNKLRLLYIALFILNSIACSELRGQNHKFKFVVFGDTRGPDRTNQVSTEILGELANEVIRQQAAFVLVPGDLVYLGDIPAFQAWSNVMAPVYEAGIGVYPARGNHDLGYDPRLFPAFFGPGLPTNGPTGEAGVTYALSHSNVLVLTLDNYASAHEVNTNWIASVLATNTALHVFATAHEPAFKVFHDDCLDQSLENRNAFWNILSNAACRVYFAGHDHFYDHARIDDGDGDPSNDLHQFIVGTGGAPLYDPAPYDGFNAGWTPTNIFREVQYGYVTVEIDGPRATLTWHHRTGPGEYAPTSEVFSYSLETSIKSSFANGKLTLTWSGGGRLESAPTQNGPWVPVENGSSPCVITNLDADHAMFRVKLR